MSTHDGTDQTTGTEETADARPAEIEVRDDQLLIDGEPIVIRWDSLLTKHIIALNSGLSLAASFDWIQAHSNTKRDTLERLRWDDWTRVQRHILETIQQRNAPSKTR